MFPNQDKLPKGGFGNLIALPLQRKARNQNNSIFIDNELEPYDDPWDILSTCKKYAKSDIDNILSRFSSNILELPLPVMDELDDKPWDKDFEVLKTTKIRKNPNCVVNIILRNQLFISKNDLTPELQNRIIRIASFQNPEFYKMQALRLSTWNIPRIISCAENHKDYISIPRGCYDDLILLLTDNDIEYILDDKLLIFDPVDINFIGKLYKQQNKAAKELLKFNSEILSATTAFGKTMVN